MDIGTEIANVNLTSFVVPGLSCGGSTAGEGAPTVTASSDFNSQWEASREFIETPSGAYRVCAHVCECSLCGEMHTDSYSAHD